jgi:transcription antitermination factor NusG
MCVNRVPGQLKTTTLTIQEAKMIMENLEHDFSPENVSCDGECSMVQIKQRIKLYKKAMSELMVMFPQLRPSCKITTLKSGDKVKVNSSVLGGKVTGTILKVNRVKCQVKFSRGVYNVPFSMMEVV